MISEEYYLDYETVGYQLLYNTGGTDAKNKMAAQLTMTGNHAGRYVTWVTRDRRMVWGCGLTPGRSDPQSVQRSYNVLWHIQRKPM